MASLLMCQEIKVSKEELQKISGGSFISPGDLMPAASGGPSEEAKQLASALKASEIREDRAHRGEIRAKMLSTAVTVGSLLVAATGLWMTWRSRAR